MEHSNRHTHTQPVYSTSFGNTWVSRYQRKHSPTHTNPAPQPSFVSFLHLPQSMASSLFPHKLSRSSLVYHLVGNPLLHPTFLHPIIVFLLQHLPILSQPVLLQYRDYILFFVSLSTPYLKLFFALRHISSDHSYLCWLKFHLIFFSLGQVSLPCNITGWAKK